MANYLFAIFLYLALCLAACTDNTRGKRRAWHTLTPEEKTAYITAELCLMKKPSSIGLPGTKTRFDEFQAAHQLQAYATHLVGSFLPFHRAIIFVHEEALREECGYKGWQPYWEEQLDAGHFGTSSIFDPVFGFGGNGVGQGNCITDGPFATYMNSLGPGYSNTEHCINRKINDTVSVFSTQGEVDKCLAAEDWLSAWACIEDMPHSGGHGGVGGLMNDPVSSPGDPLFYLHHSWLDKIWADWQAKCLPERLTEMGGRNVQDEQNLPAIFPPRPSNIPKPTGADGDPGDVTTLNHVLNMYGNGPNRTIGGVMDIWNGELCYEYISSASKLYCQTIRFVNRLEMRSSNGQGYFIAF